MTYVELRPICAPSTVQCNVLNADEVLSRGHALGDGEVHGAHVIGGPGDSVSAIGFGGDLVYLQCGMLLSNKIEEKLGWG